ncbi:MAG: asparagine synthase (glutamine-hydrolyzing) [Pirellulales bacterium]|nr:asparagine synthase (glutamine-hydrolyzing) [Pirellulales bacterium]
MCGIFGQITPGKPIDPAACLAAVQTLTHRGPDGLGVAAGRLDRRLTVFDLNPTTELLQLRLPEACDFFLGHRRLSVIDLAPEAFQPMANEDHTVWVVFNGEIYNHPELRRRLEGCGHRFSTHHSDTEVLVHGYEQWGAHVVDELRGMFALAVLDLTAERVLLARDRLGQKPLYYRLDGAGVTFASEPKALFRLLDFDTAISPAALIDYLSHGFVPAPRTIWHGMKKLRAAERLMIPLPAASTARPETYWTLNHEPVAGKSDAQWFDEFEAELSQSVRLRMASDVPLGAFLSGGLDSTAVTRQMSRASNRPVRTFSIGFHEPRFDESPYARRVAEKYGTIHHCEVLSPETLIEVVPLLADIFDEPFADSSAIPTYKVSQLARQHVTVALSGDGGDELLAGYRRYRLQHQLSRMLDPHPRFLLKMVFGPIASLWPERARGKSLLQLLVPGAKARYFKVFLDDYLIDLAHGDLAKHWNCLLESAWSDGPRHLVDRMCATDSRFYIPEDLMVKVDRTSMHVSLEARSPLLDHKLFELIGRMPLETRFGVKRNKLPLRRLLGREWNSAFLDRRKMGFAVPLGKWFREDLRDDLRDTLLRPHGLVTSLFPRPTVERLIENHLAGSRDQSHRLWKLYMLEKWNDCHGKPSRSRGQADMVSRHV